MLRESESGRGSSVRASERESKIMTALHIFRLPM